MNDSVERAEPLLPGRPAAPFATSPGHPAEALADGLAHHLHHWALALGADGASAELAAAVGRSLSLATSDGHVCIALQPWSTQAAGRGVGLATLRSRLLASRVVGPAEAPGACPLVLDDEDRLYLHRDFALERRLAANLVARLALGSTPAARSAPTVALPAVAPPDDREPDWQALAAALALRNRLTVISGGPGTGKTTAVLRLLVALLEQAPDCRIALAAPTGKAAARMTEAIRQRAGALPAGLRARLPAHASTLHRLLGVTPATRGRPGEGFVHHAGNPLNIDLLVIDEASMLDLALATRVFEAVPPAARIVLLGDQDQLSAVESGAVFAELSADPGLGAACIADLASRCGIAAERIRPPAARARTGLRDCVVWFRHNFRFAADSGIGQLARLVQAGAAAPALAWLAALPAAASLQTAGPAPAAASIRWLPDAGALPGPDSLALLQAGYARYLAVVQHYLDGHADVAGVLGAFDHFRVLCAVREGPRGVAGINRMLSRHARATLVSPGKLPGGGEPGDPWYAGRPVMLLRNDPLLRLFNGDIGIALPERDAAGRPGALRLWFNDAAQGLRAVAPQRLPEHDSAWAMTVHKAQGSEFDRLALLLPAEAQRVLSRELLYTAVTRARQGLDLIGSAELIGAAIAAPTQRHSGLLARIREATEAAAAVAQ